VCLAQSDDWLNEHETQDAAHKSQRWLTEAPTEAQLCRLPPALRANYGLTRYQASALITFQFNKRAIQQLVYAENERYLEAA
jgi:DNA repair protein RadD